MEANLSLADAKAENSGTPYMECRAKRQRRTDGMPFLWLAVRGSIG